MNAVITASPITADFSLARHLPSRLGLLSTHIGGRIARICRRRFRLSAPEWRILAALGQKLTMTGAEMMSATAMDKVRVSRGIAKLLNSGLITREADPKDRRRAILTPTTAGREIFQQIVPMIQDAEAAMMAALNAPERDALNDALAKIEDYLERT